MAENEKRGTIYQQLNSFFNFDGFGFDPKMTDPDTAKIIIKGKYISANIYNSI